MASNAEYLAVNQRGWDELTLIHLRGISCYPIEEFKKGACCLRERERTEVGHVSGKSLLHLQCHFGMDTLAWARLGAKVTGVDFHPRLSTPRGCSRGRFACQPNSSAATSMTCGSICPDNSTSCLHPTEFSATSRTCASGGRSFRTIVRGGGFFYIADGHPVNNCIKEDQGGAGAARRLLRDGTARAGRGRPRLCKIGSAWRQPVHTPGPTPLRMSSTRLSRQACGSTSSMSSQTTVWSPVPMVSGARRRTVHRTRKMFSLMASKC